MATMKTNNSENLKPNSLRLGATLDVFNLGKQKLNPFSKDFPFEEVPTAGPQLEGIQIESILNTYDLKKVFHLDASLKVKSIPATLEANYKIDKTSILSSKTFTICVSIHKDFGWFTMNPPDLSDDIDKSKFRTLYGEFYVNAIHRYSSAYIFITVSVDINQFMVNEEMGLGLKANFGTVGLEGNINISNSLDEARRNKSCTVTGKLLNNNDTNSLASQNHLNAIGAIEKFIREGYPITTDLELKKSISELPEIKALYNSLTKENSSIMEIQISPIQEYEAYFIKRGTLHFARTENLVQLISKYTEYLNDATDILSRFNNIRENGYYEYMGTNDLTKFEEVESKLNLYIKTLDAAIYACNTESKNDSYYEFDEDFIPFKINQDDSREINEILIRYSSNPLRKLTNYNIPNNYYVETKTPLESTDNSDNLALVKVHSDILKHLVNKKPFQISAEARLKFDLNVGSSYKFRMLFNGEDLNIKSGYVMNNIVRDHTITLTYNFNSNDKFGILQEPLHTITIDLTSDVYKRGEGPDDGRKKLLMILKESSYVTLNFTNIQS